MAVKEYFRTLGIYEALSMSNFMKRAKVSDTKSIDIIIEYIVSDTSKQINKKTDAVQKSADVISKYDTIKSIDQIATVQSPATKSPTNKISFFDGVEIRITYEAKPKGYAFTARFVKTYNNQDEALLCIDKKIKWLANKLWPTEKPEIRRKKFIVKNINRKNIQEIYLSMVRVIKKDIAKKAEEKTKKTEAINNVLEELVRIAESKSKII